MLLDPRTLLFSLILTNSLMVLSLFVAASLKGREQGLNKWALAVLLETFTWLLIAGRGVIPDEFSVVLANLLKAASFAMFLAAIYEFQRRDFAPWKFFVPVVLQVAVSGLLIDDIAGRFVWGGVIYAFQAALIVHALLSDSEMRKGRAWRLLYGGSIMILIVLAMRAVAALSGMVDFAQPQNHIAIHWVQVVTFISVMATALLGSVGFILMIKERTDHEIMLLAMTDSLTGVPNRRALMDQGARVLAQRSGRPMSLLMIDVDHFKRINDTYGHPAGDEVLRQAVALMAQRLRGGDVLGRYGGEEFCVIAPDTDAAGALILAEALREIIAITPLQTEAGVVAVTVSIGIACSAGDGKSALKRLLAEADAALYQAKQAGRNRVCFSGNCRSERAEYASQLVV
ncbi:MAG: GGDEF domain-containing protein [Gammaproteobacteria bacterium]|nr:GGDEF domain-containing protein [Gammaproteobacteria bacterium]MBU1623586.1 GGDEF domain-containing protein [Gammaproteobacteria bacterium]